MDFRAGIADDNREALVHVDNAFEEDALQLTYANTANASIRPAVLPPGNPPFTFILPLNQTPILPNERQWGVGTS